MDTRTARRAAEKAARDLIASRAALIGGLGVAAAERTQLAADVTAAADRGRQLVAAAETEAARLVTAAHALAADGEQRYTDAYTAATAGGWATSDLTALGFQPAATTAHRRRPHRADPRAVTTRPTPTEAVSEHPSLAGPEPELQASASH